MGHQYIAYISTKRFFHLDNIVWQSLATADIVGSLAGAIYLATAIRPQMQKDSLKNPLILEEGRYICLSVVFVHCNAFSLHKF